MDDPPVRPPHGAASIELELDRPEARPGDRIRLRVLVSGAVEGHDAIHGLGSTLEHKAADGGWEPMYFLRFSHLTDGADFLRYGNPRWGAVRAVGLSGPAWRPVQVPDDAPPGEYRIVKRVGGRDYAVPLVIR